MILFFFNDTATTEIYTLSLHDALPICQVADGEVVVPPLPGQARLEAAPDEVVGRQVGGQLVHVSAVGDVQHLADRSEEHTSELQSQSNLVCRLLLEKKKKITPISYRLT